MTSQPRRYTKETTISSDALGALMDEFDRVCDAVDQADRAERERAERAAQAEE